MSTCSHASMAAEEMPQPEDLLTILRPIIADYPETEIIDEHQHRIDIAYHDYVVVVCRERCPEGCCSRDWFRVTSFLIPPGHTTPVSERTLSTDGIDPEGLADVIEEHFSQVAPEDRLAAADGERRLQLPFNTRIRASTKIRLEQEARRTGTTPSALIADILERHALGTSEEE